MKCKKCKEKIYNENNKFCPQCGTKTEWPWWKDINEEEFIQKIYKKDFKFDNTWFNDDYGGFSYKGISIYFGYDDGNVLLINNKEVPNISTSMKWWEKLAGSREALDAIYKYDFSKKIFGALALLLQLEEAGVVLQEKMELK